MATLSWLEDLPRLPGPVRTIMVVAIHVVFFTLAYVAAFLVRFDLQVPETWEGPLLATLPFVLLIKLIAFAVLRMFQGWWKYVSLYDLAELGRGLTVASGAFLAFNVFVLEVTIPRSVYVLDFGLSLFLIGGARGSLRLLREAIRSRAGIREDAARLLIIGAGDTGETLIREIHKNRNLPYKVVGFLDDAPYKHGLRIQNVPVLGPIAKVGEFVGKHEIDELIIAMPSASRDQLRRVVDLAKTTGVSTKILPAVEAILEGHVSLNAIREVSIQDLLGRDAVRLDTASMGRFLQGRRVLVTGAGGSIGSEICRQVLRFEPKAVILVERGETPLFFIHRELSAKHDEKLFPCIADVSDADRMRAIFETYRPDVVVHAAAYKHVPLMEQHPTEAVLNNVQGTRVMADLAAEFEVGTFVLVSTDKAVNPTSVMGATKRVTELYVLSKNSVAPNTDYCAVRFGNVLGSNGSVVPIFREQIRRGGPVTVTHPEMTRYFMTIPEASQLVLQAAANGSGGELFILDMGEPVRIADLARDMIRLSGLTEDEVEITFTGVRPGEKLYEELTLDEERVGNTKHDKIFTGRTSDDELGLLREHLDDLLESAREGDAAAVRAGLKRIVPQCLWEADEKIVKLEAKRPTRKTPALE